MNPINISSAKRLTPETKNKDLKARLVTIARDVVRNNGMDALNLRIVAEQGDTSTQAIYTLFGNKSGLIQAMYTHWVTELEARLRVDIATLSPEALILKTAQIYREQALSDPALFMAGSTTLAAVEADVIRMMYDSQAFALLTNFVKAGMDLGMFKPRPDPKVTAKMLWAAVHGSILFEIYHPVDNQSVDALVELIALLSDGLKA